MKFVDYAPPASPSLEQQRDALRKGLGRAVQWAMTGRLHDEPLLEAGLQDQRFDWQCESSRSGWLWDMLQRVGTANRFRVPILHALYELADEHNADQLCELALCYAQAGDEAFRSRLYEIVEKTPFPQKAPYPGEEEIIKLDGEPAFLFAAQVRGRTLIDGRSDWDDGSLTHFAVEHLGKERVSSLLEASSDAAIRRFRDELQRNEQRRVEQSQRISHKERIKAISVAKIIREAEGESKCYWFRGWGMHAGDAELRMILQRLWTEREVEILVKLLRVFSGRVLPDFDPRFIELCGHGNEDVRRWSIKVLEQNTHPLIRDFALAELQKGIPNESMVGLFINNYRPGDEQRILEAVELPADACQLHWLLTDVIEILEKYPSADCTPLGLISYAWTPCGPCRFRATRLLLKQQAAPQWLKEECRHDSRKDCRELFAKAAGSTEAG